MRRYSATAVWQNQEIASTDQAILVEGNYYFPLEDVQADLLLPSSVTTFCPWKGIARYRHLQLENQRIKNVAWTYPLPFPFAWFIRRRIAFDEMTGVKVSPKSPRA